MFRILALWNDLAHLAQAWLPTIRDYAVAIIVVAAALAVAHFARGIRTKFAALVVACAIIATTIAYSVGHKRGADRVKADWDWTLETERREGEQVRAEAERAVRVESPDSSVLSNDPWNRDAQPDAFGRAQGGRD